MALNGRNVLITMDGRVIAGTKSNEAQAEAELIERSSKKQGRWREYLTGRKGWTMTVNFLVLAGSGVRDLLKVGNEYTLVFKERNEAGVSGSAILTTCRITSTIGNLVQGTFQFVGNGEPM